jgi:hypothetical protein
MKKLILLTLIVLSNIVAYGQNFPSTSVELLLGKELKVREKAEQLQKYGYKDFYVSEIMKVKYDAGQSDANTRYESLVGKVFRMIDFKQYTDRTGAKKFAIKIENPETGILYYDYDPRYEEEFEFVVIGGLKYPEGFFDTFVKTFRDKFKNEKSYSTPTGCDKITFLKTISHPNIFNSAKTVSKIYMQVSEIASEIKLNSQGMTILLENDLRIDIPRERLRVETNSVSEGFVYTALLELRPDQIKMLTENKMTDYRLYLYDKEIVCGYTLKEYLKSIVKVGEKPVVKPVEKPKVEEEVVNPKDAKGKKGATGKDTKGKKGAPSKDAKGKDTKKKK